MPRTGILAAVALACAPAATPPPADSPKPAAEPSPPPAAVAHPVADSAPAVRDSAPGTPASAPTRDRLAVTEDEYQGWKYYAVYCERCHAPDAVGTADAPDLRYSVSPEGEVTADSFAVIVRNGSEDRKMKGFEGLLDDQRIAQIYAYVLARSEERLAPGRPHRASAQ